MRHRPSIALVLFAILGVLGFLLRSSYNDVRGRVIDDLNAQQAIHARQAAKGIEDHMAQILTTLDFLAHLPQVAALDSDGKRILADWKERYRAEIAGVTRVDSTGRILYTVPHSPAAVGRDISGQEHVREILRTRRPVVSDVFTAVQGFRAIAVHSPVFVGDRFEGTVAFLLSFDHIAKRYLEDIKIGAGGYAWVLSEKGVELSCPVPGHVGRNVAETCRDFPDVLAMVALMLRREQGVTTYHFDRVRGAKTERLLKHAVFMPIPIANTFWSIVVATPEDEVVASMEGFRLKFMGITLVLLGSCTACTVLLVRARIVASEQKKRDVMGRALRESDALYRALIETTNTGFVVLDPQGIVLDANQEYVRLAGRGTLDEVKGRNVLTWTADYEKQKHAAAASRCAREGFLRNLAIDYVDAAGKITCVEINATAVEKEGSRQILAICRDVTQRLKLEAQLAQAQRMESVGRLAGGVAHDFNNMLNVINGYTELALMKTAPDAPTHHYLREIFKAGERSANLTRQLLAFARRQIAKPEVLDLNGVVSGIVGMLQRLIGENIDLAWVPGEGLWEVSMDPSQVDQILTNLVVNAKDAISGTGKVTIETSNRFLDEGSNRGVGCPPGEYVLLRVTDDGYGMTREALANAFEPFFSTKGVGRGTGLGLATVYGIVTQNGGVAEISSGLGTGTTVDVYLPRFRGEAPAASPEKRGSSSEGGTETLLLVEDDETVLEMTKGMLEQLGYTVLTASRPADAVLCAAQYGGPIQLVVTDVVMPEMNGKELMDRLAEVRPGVKGLYMSGYTSDVIAHHGILESGVQFLQKPFSREDLARKVRGLLDGEGGGERFG